MAPGKGARGRNRGRKREGGGSFGHGGDFGGSAARVNTLECVRKGNGKITVGPNYNPPGTGSGAEQGEQGSRYRQLERTTSTCTSIPIDPTSTIDTGSTPSVSDMAQQVDSATDRNIEMLQVRSSYTRTSTLANPTSSSVNSQTLTLLL